MMKTSNKLILTALLLVLISLFAYDYLLKGVYMSGKYKDPYNGFVNLNFKDFDTVDIVSSTAANVKFVPGPFKIRIDTNFIDYVKLKQKGRRLQINTVFEFNYLSNPNPYVLVISCPKLAEVNANAIYRSYNKEVTDTIAKDDWYMRRVLIDGFSQHDLSIHQDYGSTVVLANNRILSINGVIGLSEKSGSKLIVLKNNQFGNANFDVRHRSSLILNDAQINNLNYHLADSAKVTLIGKAQSLLNNTKSIQK